MIHILLPAFNEAEALPGLVERLASALAEREFRVLVLDDGSPDATAEVARKLAAEGRPVELLRHEKNLGLGETVRDLFREAAARSSSGDFIIRMDADGTQDPGIIPEMLAALTAGADVVVASRYRAGAEERGVPFLRRVLSRAASLVFRLVFPARGLRDYSSGFRACRAEILKKAHEVWGARFVELTRFGFAPTVEKVLKLRALGARFAEVPIRLASAEKKKPSRLRLLPTALGCLRLLLAGLNPWGELRKKVVSSR